jgi:hypothetical protein
MALLCTAVDVLRVSARVLNLMGTRSRDFGSGGQPVCPSSVSADAVREKPAVSRATELKLSRKNWPGVESEAFVRPSLSWQFPGQYCPPMPVERGGFKGIRESVSEPATRGGIEMPAAAVC